MTRALFGRRTQVNKLPVRTSRSAGVRAGPPAAIGACDPSSPTRPRRALPWLQAAPRLIAVAPAGSGERGQWRFVGGISLRIPIWHGHSDEVVGTALRGWFCSAPHNPTSCSVQLWQQGGRDNAISPAQSIPRPRFQDSRCLWLPALCPWLQPPLQGGLAATSQGSASPTR